MKFHVASPRVALVYPPFGPPHLANLGIAVLSAGVKQRGFVCRTFYWSYRFARWLPGNKREREGLYHLLTQRALSPWNEWIFSRWVFGEALTKRDGEAIERLRGNDRVLERLTAPRKASEIILGLAGRVESILEPMVEELRGFDVIGVTTTFFQNGAALALCRAVKERYPGKITVLGGANCDGGMGRALIETCPFVDAVFSGEVDHDFPEFIERVSKGEPIGTIKGLHFRAEDGSVMDGPPSEPLQDMDSLPFPDFDDWLAERKQFGLFDARYLRLPLESSRGCWWGAKSHCTFCGLNANGMAYRQKSTERFQAEVRAMADRYDVKYLFMADNILSTKYYKTFVEWAKGEQIGINMFYEIKANTSRDQVAALAAAGISMVQPGIEHFSSAILKLMRKGIRGIQNIAFLKYAAEHGVTTIYSILGGFPGEDPNEYVRLSREVRKLVHFTPPGAVIDIEFHRFSPYHNNPDEFKISLRPHHKYSFIFPFPEETLARLAYQFELNGRSNQNLTYLTSASAAVKSWQDSFDPGQCTLTWREENDEIVIEDRRNGFPACDYRLKDFAVAVFLALEEPRTLKAAAQEAQKQAAARMSAPFSLPKTSRFAVKEISFQAADFGANPIACVEPLVAAGVLYEDAGEYLNLPVSASYVQRHNGWRFVEQLPSEIPA